MSMNSPRTRRVGALTLVSVLASSLIIVSGGVALAEDRVCRSTIGARTIDDNIVVPHGVSCTLDGTTVKGNVFVRADARAILVGARVDGNVQGSGRKVAILLGPGSSGAR